MLWRNARGRPLNAPAAFIHPCQPTVAEEPPSGPGWAHELKHDGYRLQIHVHDDRVRLYTMNGTSSTPKTSRSPRRPAEVDGARASLPHKPAAFETATANLGANMASDMISPLAPVQAWTTRQ